MATPVELRVEDYSSFLLSSSAKSQKTWTSKSPNDIALYLIARAALLPVSNVDVYNIRDELNVGLELLQHHPDLSLQVTEAYMDCKHLPASSLSQILMHRAQIYQETNSWEEARDAALQALLYTNDASTNLALYKIYDTLKDRDKAAQHLEAAFEKATPFLKKEIIIWMLDLMQGGYIFSAKFREKACEFLQSPSCQLLSTKTEWCSALEKSHKKKKSQRKKKRQDENVDATIAEFTSKDAPHYPPFVPQNFGEEITLEKGLRVYAECLKVPRKNMSIERWRAKRAEIFMDILHRLYVLLCSHEFIMKPRCEDEKLDVDAFDKIWSFASEHGRICKERNSQCRLLALFTTISSKAVRYVELDGPEEEKSFFLSKLPVYKRNLVKWAESCGGDVNLSLVNHILTWVENLLGGHRVTGVSECIVWGRHLVKNKRLESDDTESRLQKEISGLAHSAVSRAVSKTPDDVVGASVNLLMYYPGLAGSLEVSVPFFSASAALKLDGKLVDWLVRAHVIAAMYARKAIGKDGKLDMCVLQFIVKTLLHAHLYMVHGGFDGKRNEFIFVLRRIVEFCRIAKSTEMAKQYEAQLHSIFEVEPNWRETMRNLQESLPWFSYRIGGEFVLPMAGEIEES